MRLGLLALLPLATPAVAGGISLSSPIDCNLNGPCFIQQYVDHDPSSKASDFTCSSLSYDGHKGTDFALPTYDMITQGIDVLASASGTVAGIRDGMQDVRYSSERDAEINGRECGNGVLLRHTDGWETQYCHLRKGSITVSKGQKVTTGDILGQVGMSGRAEFPHLHLSVRHEGKVIDPFDPDGTITCGETEKDTLWSQPPTYRAGGIITVGTSDAIPEFSDIRANRVSIPNASSDAFVIYAFLFGTQKSDVVRLSLFGPNGEIIEQDTLMKRHQAQSFRAAGKKLNGGKWPSGRYTGTAWLLRDDVVIDRHSVSLTLP